MTDRNIIKTKEFIRELLAQLLGLEPDDIKDDDLLSTDLHMRPTDISDFLAILDENGIDTTKLDLTEIESFSDLVEKLGVEEYT